MRVSNAVGTTNSNPIQVSVGAADRFAGNWPTMASDANRDNHQAAALGRHRFQLIWESEPLPRLGLNPPAIAEGRLFVTARNPNRPHEIRAYHLTTGELLWSRSQVETFLVLPAGIGGGFTSRKATIRGPQPSVHLMKPVEIPSGVPKG